MKNSIRSVVAALLLLGATLIAAAPAAAQDAPAAEPPATEPAATEPAAPVEIEPIAPVIAEHPSWPASRASRWAPMTVGYKLMNLRHPTLYYQSIQERREFPDSAVRGCCGTAASGLYEIVQFPVQLMLTPVSMLANPPWQWQRAAP